MATRCREAAKEGDKRGKGGERWEPDQEKADKNNKVLAGRSDGGGKRKEKVPVIGEWVLRKGQKIKGGKRRFVPQLSKNRS